MTVIPRQFRTTFKVEKSILNWYPGHMKHSLVHMQAKMRNVDCVIEIHDSRVPFTGRNPAFLKNLVGSKPHILVLNKMDLIKSSSCEVIRSQYIEQEEENVIFSNCLNQRCSGLKKVLSLALDLIREQTKIPKFGDSKYRLMVVGIPNVGKSSFINALRSINIHKGKATPVGAIAGVTRSVQTDIKIWSEPPTYLIDTPGILCPKIIDNECGMKLALCGCLNDDVIGHVLIADFLLYWLNKTKNFEYVEILNIKEPVDNITPLLAKIASDFNKKKVIKDISNNKIYQIPDTVFAAQYFTQIYRKGNFGDLNLDSLYFN